jgi:hypothetical protein
MGFNTLGYGLKSLSNPSTSVTLQSGQYAVLPSGQYMVMPGKYTFLQFYDPVSTTWRNVQGPAQGQPFYLSSDGYNYRLFNPTGTVVGAVVTNGGTANTSKNGFWAAGSSSTPGVVATTTGSATFNAIVGGAVNTSVTVNTAGSGYVYQPLITFSPPPAGGLSATGYATLTNGTVTGITVTNQGAGYTTAPTITITPVNGDPGNGATATATLDSTNSGKLVALTMANPGQAYTAVPTITIAGLAGSPAATAIMCFAVTTAPTAAGATHYGNGNIAFFGGAVTAGSNTTTNPAYTTGLYTPRLGYAAYSTSASLASITIEDGGLNQVDASNQVAIAFASDGTIPGATTFSGGASGGVTDQSFVIPI